MIVYGDFTRTQKCEAIEIFDDGAFGYWNESMGNPIHEVPCTEPATVIVDSEGQGGSMAMCADHAKATVS
ncbi:MAG: hypothetical protein M3Q75_02120 [Gemmatimonadota bacterium]|nr:hypothetical protein [Gemmatimonadota bacterium]